MRTGAEELEGERGVALLVEAFVVEDVGGAEDGGVAARSGREDDQAGEACARVAGDGGGFLRRVAGAAHVRGAGPPGGGEFARRGEGTDGLVRFGADAGGQPGCGSRPGGDQQGASRGVGSRFLQPELLGAGQEVGAGDQECGVGSGRCGGLVEGGGDGDGYAACLEEFSHGPAALGVRGAGVELSVVRAGAYGSERDAGDDEDEDDRQDASGAGPDLTGGGCG